MEERRQEYEQLKMDVKSLKEELEKLKARVDEWDEDDENESEDGDDANKPEEDGDGDEAEALGEVDSEEVSKTWARAVAEKLHKTISDHAVHDVKKDAKKVRTTGTTTKTVKKPKQVIKAE